MDGNGRWAKRRGLPRSFGHKQGVESVRVVVRRAQELGIKFVTFFAFSTENWNRPKEEVDYIFQLAYDYLLENKDVLVSKGICLKVIGNLSRLPVKLQKEIAEAVELTKSCDSIVVTIALNYGGRDDIVQAVNKIVGEGKSNITEKSFANYLYTAGTPDPDLVIRTSGELRVSNFLMYQMAYAEMYFPKIHWPAFRAKALDKAIRVYQKRNRKFGAIKK